MKKFFTLILIFIISFSAFAFSGCSFFSKNNQNDTVKKFTVSFETNGGSAIAKKIVKSGTILALNDIAETTKENNNFLGWYLDSNLSKEASFPYTVSKNIKFYAKWKEIPKVEPPIQKDFRVIYNTDGGDEIEDTFVEVIEKEPDVYKKGYKVLYWYNSKNEKISFPYTVDKSGDVLRVEWYLEPDNWHSVEIRDKEGKFIKNYNYIDVLRIEDMPTVPEISGYKFKGWGPGLDLDEVVSFPLILNRNYILYPIYEKIIIKEDSDDITIQKQFYNFTFDILARLAGYFGLGIDNGFTFEGVDYDGSPKTYVYTGESIMPINTPMSTDKEYLDREIFSKGTSFDAIRSSFYTTVTYDTCKDYCFDWNYHWGEFGDYDRYWWEMDDLDAFKAKKNEYATLFINLNFNRYLIYAMQKYTGLTSAYCMLDFEGVTEEEVNKKIQDLLKQIVESYDHFGLTSDELAESIFSIIGDFGIHNGGYPECAYSRIVNERMFREISDSGIYSYKDI